MRPGALFSILCAKIRPTNVLTACPISLYRKSRRQVRIRQFLADLYSPTVIFGNYHEICFLNSTAVFTEVVTLKVTVNN